MRLDRLRAAGRRQRPRGRVGGAGGDSVHSLHAGYYGGAAVHGDGAVALLAVVVVTPRPNLGKKTNL